MTVSELGAVVGHQVPRLSSLPIRRRSDALGIADPVADAGRAAIELAAVAGLLLDPWQQWCVEQILGEREETYYNETLDRMMHRSSAYESAIVVARQNGKGAILEAVELAWLYLQGVRTIIHSAHEFPTSREHFLRMENLISNTPELKAELARGGIKWSHGDESINLATGQRLLFKTRTKGAARGFSPDKIVFDEAMKLKSEHVAAMKYAASARPDPQFVYTGSASSTINREAGESIHFGKARSRGMAGEDPRLFYAEWSADICNDFCTSDCDVHDDPANPETWARSNPGLGYRIEPETIQSEYLGDPREVFLCERLSHGDWPTESEEWSVIPEELWKAREDEGAYMAGDFVLGVDTTPDRSYTCLTAAGCTATGDTLIEVTSSDDYDHHPGDRWVVRRVLEVVRNRRPLAVVIDKTSQAASFIPELEEAGVKVLSPNSNEFATSCGDFYSAVVPRKDSVPYLVHVGQPPLTNAVAGADKRDLANTWAWSRRNSAVDISPLVAGTLAMWGYKKLKHEKKASPPWVVRR